MLSTGDGRNVLLPPAAVTSDDDDFKFRPIIASHSLLTSFHWENTEMEVVPENSGSLKRVRSISSANVLPRTMKEVYCLVDFKDTSSKFTLNEKKIKTIFKQSLLLEEPRPSGSKNSLKGESSQSLEDMDFVKLRYDKRDKSLFLVFMRRLVDKKTSPAFSILKISGYSTLNTKILFHS